MTAARTALADRIRAALPQDRALREVSMFGGRSFMVDQSMVVAAGRDGDLLVRIDPARNEELLAAGATPAVMGVDRPMGPGWVSVPGDSIADDAQLAFWLQVGLDHLDAQHHRDAQPGPRPAPS